MRSVVVLGCWTAGKTSIGKRFRDKFGELLPVLDSDWEISRSFGGCIYNIYLGYARSGDLEKANEHIDFQERMLLTRLLNQSQPFLLTCGPLLPTREPIWQAFLNCVKPVCYHLRVSPEDIYAGLKKRRSWQERAGLDLSPGFGSWDDGLLTEQAAAGDEWLELSKTEALEKITNKLNELTPIYEKACSRETTFCASMLRNDPLTLNKFDEQIAIQLGATANPLAAISLPAPQTQCLPLNTLSQFAANAAV